MNNIQEWKDKIIKNIDIIDRADILEYINIIIDGIIEDEYPNKQDAE